MSQVTYSGLVKAFAKQDDLVNAVEGDKSVEDGSCRSRSLNSQHRLKSVIVGQPDLSPAPSYANSYTVDKGRNSSSFIGIATSSHSSNGS